MYMDMIIVCVKRLEESMDLAGVGLYDPCRPNWATASGLEPRKVRVQG